MDQIADRTGRRDQADVEMVEDLERLGVGLRVEAGQLARDGRLRHREVDILADRDRDAARGTARAMRLQMIDAATPATFGVANEVPSASV